MSAALYRVKPSIAALIDPDVWAGRRTIDMDPFLVEIDEPEYVDRDLLKSLLEHSLSMGLDTETELDQWLAPRFHNALRISRRLAGDPGFWTWLVLDIGMPYVRHRWPQNLYRVTGDFKRNGLSRLWFFAEMARNGVDYSDVRKVLRTAGTAQYAMENRYAMYRPAVIAFGRVAEQAQMPFEDMKQLSKRINAYLSLRSLEGSGYMAPDEERDEEWWSDRPTIRELVDGEPRGPRDNQVPAAAIDELVKWFESLTKTSSVDEPV